MWATFLSNDHFWFWNWLRDVDCALWIFWVEFFVGLGGWMLAFVSLLYSQAFIFNRRIRNMRPRKRAAIRYVLYVLIFAPLLALCVVITLVHLQGMDGVSSGCMTPPFWKFLLFIWIVFTALVLVAAYAWLAAGIRHNRFKREYRAIKHILILGIVVVVLCIVLNVLGLLQRRLWRMVFTSAIACVHVFVPVRLIGYRMYKALCNDKEYSDEVVGGFQSYNIKFKRIHELVESYELMDAFLNDCAEKHSVLDTRADPPKIVIPGHYRGLYLTIEDYEKNSIIATDPTIISDLFDSIWDTYLAEDAQEYVNLPSRLIKSIREQRKREVLKANSFRAIKKELLNQLDYFWGEDHLKHLNSIIDSSVLCQDRPLAPGGITPTLSRISLPDLHDGGEKGFQILPNLNVEPSSADDSAATDVVELAAINRSKPKPKRLPRKTNPFSSSPRGRGGGEKHYQLRDNDDDERAIHLSPQQKKKKKKKAYV